MASHLGDAPVHSSLEVQAREDVFRNDEWWKSAVRYQFEGSDATEVAVYLWHRDDDGWTRKQKYAVKTQRAWAEDEERIDRFLSGEFPPADETYPTSDYYTVTGGETVFRSDEWWKAIVNVGVKGDYETDEVMIYLWQKNEADWRRRQKSVIKSDDDWIELSSAVESVLQEAAPASEDEPDRPDVDGNLDEMQQKIDAHLSAVLE
jgi:hypothetical protein